MKIVKKLMVDFITRLIAPKKHWWLLSYSNSGMLGTRVITCNFKYVPGLKIPLLDKSGGHLHVTNISYLGKMTEKEYYNYGIS